MKKRFFLIRWLLLLVGTIRMIVASKKVEPETPKKIKVSVLKVSGPVDLTFTSSGDEITPYEYDGCDFELGVGDVITFCSRESDYDNPATRFWVIMPNFGISRAHLTMFATDDGRIVIADEHLAMNRMRVDGDLMDSNRILSPGEHVFKFTCLDQEYFEEGDPRIKDGEWFKTVRLDDLVINVTVAA